MRQLLVAMVVFVTVPSTIQSQESQSFEKVIQAEGISKKNLFSSGYDWFASSFNTANEVIQMADKEAGIIIGNGSLEYGYKGLSYICYNGWVKYTVKVYFKDNRYKVIVTNLSHSVEPGNSSKCALGTISSDPVHSVKGVQKKYNNKVFNDIKSKMKLYSNEIFEDMESHINNLKLTDSDDDW